ncbi:MAG: LacI family DNA-binding transcriptional regulator [Chloroflexi bacterium]|nr:LacI family DNA-binding transcriptional regulator [Chloroflexota bacterium]
MTSTIRDVARQAGVGIGTVSRVLNGNAAVSEPTRERVLEAITSLNYVPNQMARRLSLGKTMTVGVIVPFFTRPSPVERLRGVEAIIAETPYDLNLFNVETLDRRHRCFQEAARKERVDGLLIISVTPTAEEAHQLRQTSIPTILVDAHSPFFSNVAIDDAAGGYAATQHLLDLGHKTLGFVSDHFDNDLGNGSSEARFKGFTRALQEAGLSANPAHVRHSIHGRRPAREMAHQILSHSTPPTAIFAASDTQAIGVLEAAEALGLHIPSQLSVIGYDDIEMAEYLNLTTVRQPLFESGKLGMELLLTELLDETSAPTNLVLPTQVIARGTTAFRQ